MFDDIGQLLVDQMTAFIGRKPALIEAEAYDDETGDGYNPLSRWGDRVYRPLPNHYPFR